MLLTAHQVFPISTPAIRDGAVWIKGDRIHWAGPRKDFQGTENEILDLGDSILMPGLVNTHGHLEFASTSPSSLPQGERESFTRWVRESRASEPPTPAIIQQVLRGGSTTVADHCSPETAFFKTPFRRILFWEVLGSDLDRARHSFEMAAGKAEEFGGYVTPHSLYAVHSTFLSRVVQEAVSVSSACRRDKTDSKRRGPAKLSIHILESSDEDQFFRKGRGPLADLVRERGGVLPFPDSSPIHWLHQEHYLGPQTLIVHGNYLRPDEIQWLQTSGASVIHCPGSHRFFGHRRFPYEALKKAGVPVALGTDSLASNEDLSMLREMRLFHEAYPDVATDEVLKMATIHGANALGLDTEIGSIEVGKKADLVAVSGPDVLSAREASFVMMDGKRVF